MAMKVFKMNECDWVCAENEQQAKEFYEKQTGFTKEEINQDFEGEINLLEKMNVLAEDVPDLEKPFPFRGELWVKKSFAWVIVNEKISVPCVIASTEH